MPIEVGIWRLGNAIQPIQFTPMPCEQQLEAMIANDISILDRDLLLIGRQVRTGFDKYIDLLAMDVEGRLVVIELKRDKTSREVVAQLLDYGSWIRTLKDEEIASIFDDYLREYKPESVKKSLDEAFAERFPDIKEIPEPLNDGHKLIVVANELDNSTERIVNYLADEYGVEINALFFNFFRDGEAEYLTRVWLIEPSQAENIIDAKREGNWNGEYYVAFGKGPNQNWEDAVKYGYISAGGRSWCRKALDMLEENGRIWVNVPGRGYVGTGRVVDTVKSITEFRVKDDGTGKTVPITQVINYHPTLDQPIDQIEYYVSVEWIKTVPLVEAVREKGFFGNQNIVSRPKDPRWAHTIGRLKTRWGITE